MYQFVGKQTNKVYTEGTKQECFRKLIDKYPNYKKTHFDGSERLGKFRVSLNDPVLPEPVVIIKKDSNQ